MKILLIGCGNLGSILLKKWSMDDSINKIFVVQPSLSQKHLYSSIAKVLFISKIEEIDNEFKPDAVIIAVKPQIVNDVLSKYERYNEALFVSLCVGILISDLKNQMNNYTRIIRVMPNIAMSIGQSVNLAYANSLSIDDKQIIEMLFVNTGIIVWVNQERLFDLLSPITGSGPAYFYLLAEELIGNAIKSGLDNDQATEAVIQTFIGAAALLKQNNDLKSLRKSVTSKGGITEAAIQILSSQLSDLVKSALYSAVERLDNLRQVK